MSILQISNLSQVNYDMMQLNDRAAIKIKTRVNKQQPRATPKIDMHAHMHRITHTHVHHAAASLAEKSIFWAKLLPLTAQCAFEKF